MATRFSFLGVILGMAIAACTPAPTPISSPAPEVSPSPVEPDAVTTLPAQDVPPGTPSWAEILGETSAPEGWQVRLCEPGFFLCVDSNGEQVGVIELLAYPLSPETQETLLPNAPDSLDNLSTAETNALLQAFVENHYAAITNDRQSLGEGLTVQTDEPTVISFGNLPGLRYGFTTTSAEGQVIERSLGYVTFNESMVYVIATIAPESDGGISFKTDELLEQFEPHLTELVANLQLGNS